MSVSLDRPIGPQTRLARLVNMPSLPSPFYGRLDDEIVGVDSFKGGAARIVRGRLGTTPQHHDAGTELVELPSPGDAAQVDEARLTLYGDGAPADGPAGTGALQAASGSQYIDLSAGVIHVNTGSADWPTWRGSAAPGGGVGDKTFAHYQASAAATWLVEHHLGKLPAVTVLDSARTQVIGDVIYLDPDHLEVRFSAPFSGVAVCN
jgi:hypothetical protein